MTTPPASEPEGRVLRFRPRGSLFARNVARPPAPVADLDKFESTQEPDDYRHRMIMNGLAAAVVIVLIYIGIWLVDTIAQMRKDQDCVISGRRTCTPIPMILPR